MERDQLNWVSTAMREISELMQLLIVMSIKRYFPAIGTAGLERSTVKGYSLFPCPPPKMTAKISLVLGIVDFLSRY